MKPRLVIVSGPNQGETRWLERSELIIGRHAPSDWCLCDDAISRQQCVIKSQGGTYSIVDFKSRNGSFVNGVSVRHKVLRHGDKIRLGSTQLLFLQRDGEKEPSSHSSEMSGVVQRRKTFDDGPLHETNHRRYESR